MDVALLTVGDELLSGDTENTNATWLAGELSDAGVTVTRILTVPDDEAVIADAVARFHDAYDAVVVTGGIGGTPDDVTKAAVARAFAEENPETFDRYEMHLDLDAWAGVPEGARPLLTDESFAAGCVVEGVYVMPGIPEELKAMFASVADAFDGDRTTETLRTPAPEGAVVDAVTEARERFGVAVGSYPRNGDTPGRVKVTGEDHAAVSDAAAWLRERIETV